MASKIWQMGQSSRMECFGIQLIGGKNIGNVENKPKQSYCQISVFGPHCIEVLAMALNPRKKWIKYISQWLNDY